MSKASTEQLESDSRPSSGVAALYIKAYIQPIPCNLKYCKDTQKKLLLLFQGFYELSDAGSCSLSNSCNSVYSESLSSSQTSLLLSPMSPPNCHISPPPQVDVCRRRSADESSTQPNPPRGTGLHLGSSRIRASTAGAEQARPRPVSTGNHISQFFSKAVFVIVKKRQDSERLTPVFVFIR